MQTQLETTSSRWRRILSSQKEPEGGFAVLRGFFFENDVCVYPNGGFSEVFQSLDQEIYCISSLIFSYKLLTCFNSIFDYAPWNLQIRCQCYNPHFPRLSSGETLLTHFHYINSLEFILETLAMDTEPFAKWQTSGKYRWALRMTTNYTHQLLGPCLRLGIYWKFANNIDFGPIKIKINQCT